MLKAILEIVKALPALISLFREIVRALQHLQEEMDKRERAKQFEEAVRDAREKKDTSKLEEFFGRKPDKPVAHGDGGMSRLTP